MSDANTMSSEREWPEILTIEQVAEYLQLHPQVVYRHVRAGTLPASRIGRTIRFKKTLLDQYLESGAWKSIGKFMRFLDSSSGTSVRAARAEAAAREEAPVVRENTRRPRQFSVDFD